MKAGNSNLSQASNPISAGVSSSLRDGLISEEHSKQTSAHLRLRLPAGPEQDLCQHVARSFGSHGWKWLKELMPFKSVTGWIYDIVEQLTNHKPKLTIMREL